MPQHAFSTLTFTGYSNGTSIANPSTANGTGTSSGTTTTPPVTNTTTPSSSSTPSGTTSQSTTNTTTIQSSNSTPSGTTPVTNTTTTSSINSTTSSTKTSQPSNSNQTTSIATNTTQTSNVTPATSTIHTTTIIVTPTSAIESAGSTVTFSAQVSDTSNSPTITSGSVIWSDNGAGGTFSPASCTLSSGSCAISYTISSSPPFTIAITATYSGDATHSTSSGSASLTTKSTLDTTAVNVTSSPATFTSGSANTLTASITDTSNPPSSMIGIVSWSDNGAGGTFSPDACTLSDNQCALTYTPPSTLPSSITITATYGGDSGHSGSSGMTSLSEAPSEPTVSPSITVSGLNNTSINSGAGSSSTVYTGTPILPSSLLLTNDQSYYAYGDVVTVKVALPGMSLQNIAIVVADPTGNDIVSRTVTTDDNGTGQLQFKIPSNFQTGVYEDIATALVDGKNYTNSTQFNVIKTHGISIDSVQLIDQNGNPVSMIKSGQNNFVQVAISSGETIPVLMTLNLFDANQSSIGTASVNSTINPGDTQMTLSFFIPPNTQVGTADIFTDAFSNWPSDGGTPLTPESCLSASLENPATLPVSYQPTPPQSCTQTPQNLTGTTLVSTTSSMTNSQATATLGVVIQNDSLTFMSPTEAQLLALAYKNGTAPNTGAQSISLINVNLAALNSTNVSSTTAANVTNFTTLLGPGLQNNPMAQKILQEIQESKQEVANIIANETAATINANLVQQQRVAAASQLKQELTALEQANAATTPSASYSSFLATIPNNATQGVFEGEFNFMQQRVAAANAAMQNVLNNGGSVAEAVQTFNSYAAINHAQVVQMNNNLNVEYGLANSNVQSCFDNNGDLTVVNNTNPCLANMENNSTNSSAIQILSVQPTDQNGNAVSTFTRGQSGYVKVNIYSGYSTPSLVTINLFDSNLNTLGASSVKYTLSPGNSEVVLPYYVPTQATAGLASIYANVLTGWPNNGGTSETHELSYFVGLL